MTFDEAQAAAKRLNETGKYRKGWFYYAAYYDGANPEFVGKHFVMRRPKKTELHVAIYGNGKVSISEHI